MEASRRRRRRRSLPGNGTQAEAEVEGEDDLEQECAINAPGMGLGLKNIDPDQPGILICDKPRLYLCKVHAKLNTVVLLCLLWYKRIHNASQFEKILKIKFCSLEIPESLYDFDGSRQYYSTLCIFIPLVDCLMNVFIFTKSNSHLT